MDTNRPDRGSRRRFMKASALGSVALAVPGMNLWRGSSQSRLASHDFLEAAARGDLEEVRRLLATDSSLLMSADESGRSAYALALLNGHAAVGAFLVEQGYQSDVHEAALALDWDRFGLLTENCPGCVNQDHPIGGTAMYAAAAGGAGLNVWRVYAAAAHPNLNPREERGATPLQVALGYRDLATAELTAASILSNNGDPNPAANALPPPLHVAAARGSVELAEMLIHYGADVDARDRNGQLAVERAEQAGHEAVVNLLNREGEIPRVCWTSRVASDANGQPYSPPDLGTLSIYERERVVGSSHQDLPAVQEAVEAEPRLAHAVATTGEIAIEAGAHMGNKPMVEFLLGHGAPYSVPTAVMRNDLVRVRQLLDEDPQRINERGAHGFALLWYPIIGGTGLDMTQLLLDRGADVEQHHFLGTTALHWACRRGPIELVELLIEHGADVNRTGRKFGGTPVSPLQIALGSDQTAIASLLRGQGAQ